MQPNSTKYAGTPDAIISMATSLSNPYLQLAFDSDARLSSLAPPAGANLLADASLPLWELQFTTEKPPAATSSSLIKVSNNDAERSHVSKLGPEGPILAQWTVSHPVSFAVSFLLSLTPSAQFATLSNFTVSPQSPPQKQVGLWAVSVAVSGIRAPASVVSPTGLGTSTNGDLTDKDAYYAPYPSSQATMQWMAAGAAQKSGVYLGAHDAHAHAKILSWAVTNSSHDPVSSSAMSSLQPDAQPYGCHDPLVPPSAARPSAHRTSTRTIALAISSVIEGAGQPFIAPYVLPYALAIGVTAGDAPLWYEAAQLYREWAVVQRGAAWIAGGTVRERPHVFPPWLLRTNVWANTGWQCYDRFNVTQGDPPTAVTNAAAFAKRIGLGDSSPAGPLALHWYEWQCGFSHLCTNLSAGRFRFDTMYPDYFPARRGQGFVEAVDELRTKHGVRTLPYINARIFDEASASYQHQGTGAKTCARVPLKASVGATGGKLCTNFFGSYELNGSKAIFGIADPTTSY